MKTFLFIAMSFILSSCTISKINALQEKQLNEAVAICAANGGVDKIHLDGTDYLAKCANNSYVGSEQLVSKGNEYVTRDELKECSSLCLQNDGINRVEVSRMCEDVKSLGRAFACIKSKDTVTCYCSNKVHKEFSHIVE